MEDVNFCYKAEVTTNRNDGVSGQRRASIPVTWQEWKTADQNNGAGLKS